LALGFAISESDTVKEYKDEQPKVIYSAWKIAMSQKDSMYPVLAFPQDCDRVLN
jgi:hypothetical protein